MTEIIQEFFKNIFGDNVVLATIIISMLPIIELRGGIPFGMSKTFWGANALSSWKSFIFSFWGSSIVVPIIALLLIPCLNWLKKTKIFKKLALKIENHFKQKSNRMKENIDKNNDLQDNVLDESNKNDITNETGVVSENSNEIKNIKPKIRYNKKFFLKLLSIMLFVAIPLPLTGVWTGTALAVMLNIPFGWTCLIVILGNLIAGVIMQTICAIFPNFTTWILIAFLVLTLILIIYYCIKNKMSKKKNLKLD